MAMPKDGVETEYKVVLMTRSGPEPTLMEFTETTRAGAWERALSGSAKPGAPIRLYFKTTNGSWLVARDGTVDKEPPPGKEPSPRKTAPKRKKAVARQTAAAKRSTKKAKPATRGKSRPKKRS